MEWYRSHTTVPAYAVVPFGRQVYTEFARPVRRSAAVKTTLNENKVSNSQSHCPRFICRRGPRGQNIAEKTCSVHPKVRRTISECLIKVTCIHQTPCSLLQDERVPFSSWPSVLIWTAQLMHSESSPEGYRNLERGLKVPYNGSYACITGYHPDNESLPRSYNDPGQSTTIMSSWQNLERL